jgi:hypothetical protein
LPIQNELKIRFKILSAVVAPVLSSRRAQGAMEVEQEHLVRCLLLDAIFRATSG